MLNEGREWIVGRLFRMDFSGVSRHDVPSGQELGYHANAARLSNQESLGPRVRNSAVASWLQLYIPALEPGDDVVARYLTRR